MDFYDSLMSPPPTKRRCISSQNEVISDSSASVSLDVSDQRGLPEPLLYYLKQNANPKLLLKLMHTSKYFCFDEFPFMVTVELKYDDKKWEYCELGSDVKQETTNLNSISKKLWVTGILSVSGKKGSLSAMIPQMAVCDVNLLSVVNQDISFNEFKFLINASKMLIQFVDSAVMDESEEIVPLEVLLQKLPSLKWFEYDMTGERFTDELTKKIIEALSNSEIHSLHLSGIPGLFDFDAFVKYMRKHPRTFFHLSFSGYGLLAHHIRKLQDFADKLIELIVDSNFESYRRIYIEFPGQTEESYNSMSQIYNNFLSIDEKATLDLWD